MIVMYLYSRYACNYIGYIYGEILQDMPFAISRRRTAESESARPAEVDRLPDQCGRCAIHGQETAIPATLLHAGCCLGCLGFID